MPAASDLTILGVDPGTNITGYAVIASRGAAFELLTLGVIRLGFAYLDAPGKLAMLQQKIETLFEAWKPHEMALEAPFYGKNAQAMLKLGRAQGVILGVALRAGAPVAEYAPKKVKKACTGNGNADKTQVAEMLRRQVPQLREDQTDLPLDATDALAVAFCHHLQQTAPSVGARDAGSWAAYLQQNPDKIVKR